jgi:DNA-directed RNA polymerase II subunit RPB2
MDMAGTMLTGLFRQAFRKCVDEMKKQIENLILGREREFILSTCIKHETITRELRSALATGNWGKDKQGDVQKTGVA